MWEDNRGSTGFDLFYTRIVHNGAVVTSGAGLSFVANTNDQVNVVLAPDGSGGVFAAWEDDRNLATTGRDIYAQHFSPAGSFGTPLWGSSGVLVCNAAGTQRDVSILPDGVGGLFVAWSDERGGATLDDVYAQRIGAAGIASWAANGVIVSGAANEQTEPNIVSDCDVPDLVRQT